MTKRGLQALKIHIIISYKVTRRRLKKSRGLIFTLEIFDHHVRNLKLLLKQAISYYFRGNFEQ